MVKGGFTFIQHLAAQVFEAFTMNKKVFVFVLGFRIFIA